MTLPAGFVDMLRGFGPAYSAPLLSALDSAPSVSIRANRLKGICPKDNADSVPWCGAGIYLPTRPVFAADPAWHQGLYYVQDASSMVYGTVVETIVRQFFADCRQLRYLDACAAPGGKSIAALEALPADALLVSNEYDRHRANILLENLCKEGAPNVAVSQGDASAYARLPESFDIIAADAPCSGEGMMRKEAEAVAQWSPSLIEQCAATQRAIIDSLWTALRPGGVFIYSTCTFNRTENELMVAHIADTYGGESVDLGLDRYEGVFKGMDTAHHCYRFAPGHVRGEGLFVAALRKPGESMRRDERPAGKARKLQPEVKAFVERHISAADRYAVAESGAVIRLEPSTHASFLAELSSKVRVVSSGLTAGVLKGREYAPTHALALSTALQAGSFATLDLDYHDAMSYLRGEALSELPDGLARGYVLARYANMPLGFIKNIGRRANNLYPDAMRLRLDARSLPAEAPTPLISTANL
ncbi:MAG: rRNA cytosine-C5-methyltransferase [Muribaculaceae bacterium]|nr:rRNA cytosine-C5-methyltransferase [Muribaculaceae bacterium]